MPTIIEPSSLSTSQLLVAYLDLPSSDFKQKIQLLACIKGRILNNVNNYYHPLFGRVTFLQIFEFVIDCLAENYE